MASNSQLKNPTAGSSSLAQHVPQTIIPTQLMSDTPSLPSPGEMSPLTSQRADLNLLEVSHLNQRSELDDFSYILEQATEKLREFLHPPSIAAQREEIQYHLVADDAFAENWRDMSRLVETWKPRVADDIQNKKWEIEDLVVTCLLLVLFKLAGYDEFIGTCDIEQARYSQLSAEERMQVRDDINALIEEIYSTTCPNTDFGYVTEEGAL